MNYIVNFVLNFFYTKDNIIEEDRPLKRYKPSSPNNIKYIRIKKIKLNYKKIIEEFIFRKNIKNPTIQKIGRGSNGIVYKISDSYNNYALKITDDDKNELDILHMLANHKNIINNIDNIIIKDIIEYGIVFECMDTDLNNIIQSNKILSNDNIKYISQQILDGLKYVHSKNIIHGDIKPSNILINCSNYLIKLSDFGISVCIDTEEDLPQHIVTRWYRPPEVVKCEKYSYNIDIWGFGCVCYELVVGIPIFKDGKKCGDLSCDEKIDINIEGGIYDIIIKNVPLIKEKLFDKILIKNINPKIVELIEKCLTIDPNDRITLDEALNHDFILV
jgi:serine/threonine protein kinase